MPAWRLNKSMKLMNRGLETIIAMDYLLPTESYRIRVIERMVGGIPTQTYDKIFDPIDAVDTFEKLCIEAVEKTFETQAYDKFPEKVADIDVVDLTEADSE